MRQSPDTRSRMPPTSRIYWDHSFVTILLATLVSDASANREILTEKPENFTTLAWVLALVSTILSILGMVFVIAFRSKKIVTIGQPFFLTLICVGSLFQSCSLYFEVGKIEEINGIKWKTLDRLCIIQLWFLYLGNLTVLVALFCKLWRADKAWQFRKGRRILVHHVIWPFAAIVVVEFVLLVVVTTVDPPYWQEVLMDPTMGGSTMDSMKIAESNITLNITSLKGDDIVSGDIINGTTFDPSVEADAIEALDEMLIPKCFFSPRPAMAALRAISHVLIFIAQSLVIYMGYQTRTIPDDLVDTDLVFYMMVFQLSLYIPYLLLEYEVIPSGNAFHYASLVFPFLCAILGVLFLIVPKVYYVFYEKRHGDYPERRRSSTTDLKQNSIITSNRVHVTGVNSSLKGAAATDAAAAAAHVSSEPKIDVGASKAESSTMRDSQLEEMSSTYIMNSQGK